MPKDKIIKFEFQKGHPFGIPLKEIIPKILDELEREYKEYSKKEMLSTNPFPIAGTGFLNHLKQKYGKK